MFGWGGQILRVDLSNTKSSIEPVEPYTPSFIGGRGISVKMIYDEVDPQLSPYDPANMLCFGPGVLTGTPAASSGRLKVTGMAAGGLLRHAGLGGEAPAQVKLAGYDLIAIQGKADKPVYLRIHDDSIELKDASHLWGKDVYETQQILKDELGDSFEVMCIGRGGENALSFGSIHTGWGSAAGRCGLGGVMGSKNLKAIAVKGTRGVKIAKTEEFLKLAEEQRASFAAKEEVVREIVEGGDRFGAWYGEKFGTMARGNFEACDWGAMHFVKLDDFASKYGVGTHGCGSCPIFHWTVYEVPGIGKGGAKCIGVISCSSTLWNTDVYLWYEAYNLMNKYGIDVCTTANIIAFLMELYDRGIITAKDTDGIPMKKGDEKAIISAIHKLAEQEGFGELFKDGVVQGARKLGKGAEEYAMAVKELELQSYELRAFKQQALASATNTRDLIDAVSIIPYNWAASDQAGKEHWEKVAEELYGTRKGAMPNSYVGATAVTVVEEGKHAAADMIGACVVLIPRFMTPYFDIQAKLFSLATGVEMTESDLLFAAQRSVTLERAFNVMKGIRRKDDTLPKRFFEEPVPDGPYKGERLDKEKFDKALDDYYALRGYDGDGVPTKEAFKKYGLLSEWQVFKKKMRVEENKLNKAGKV